MKRLLLLLSIAVLISCNQKNKSSIEQTISNEESAVTLTRFFENIDQVVDSEVKVSGLVDHVCKHGGQRMFIVDESDNRLKITTGKGISEFEVNLEGKDVIVSGIVEEERIDDAYLDEWESEVKEGSENHESGVHDGNHAESEDSELAATLEKINNYREKIKNSEKGFLSFYSVKAEKFEVKQ